MLFKKKIKKKNHFHCSEQCRHDAVVSSMSIVLFACTNVMHFFVLFFILMPQVMNGNAWQKKACLTSRANLFCTRLFFVGFANNCFFVWFFGFSHATTLTTWKVWGDNVVNIVYKDGVFLIAMFFTSEKNVLKNWSNLVDFSRNLFINKKKVRRTIESDLEQFLICLILCLTFLHCFFIAVFFRRQKLLMLCVLPPAKKSKKRGPTWCKSELENLAKKNKKTTTTKKSSKKQLCCCLF